MTYDQYRFREFDPVAERLNIIPTFGNPASDNMLSSSGVLSPVPETPIGRLSVVSAREIEDYLEKVKQYRRCSEKFTKYNCRPSMDEKCGACNGWW